MIIDVLNLKHRWDGCTRCELGYRRSANFGEDVVVGDLFNPIEAQRCILFVHDALGWKEEKFGYHLMHKDYGVFFRGLLKKLNIGNCYITSLIACRSCVPFIDQETGEQKVWENKKGGEPTKCWADRPPTKTFIDACHPRLLDEVYTADPLLIVTLGKTASEVFAEKPVNLMRDHGTAFHYEMEGKLFVPSLTDKKKVWQRGSAKNATWPIKPNTLRYTVIPTIHPMVALSEVDPNSSAWKKDPKHIMNILIADLKKVKAIFDKYHHDVHGIQPVKSDDEEILSLLDERFKENLEEEDYAD